MNRLFCMTGLALALAVVTASALADAVPRIEAHNMFVSRYVWRGFGLSDQSVVRSEVALGYNDLSLRVCSKYDSGRSKKINEVDYTLGYAKKWGAYALNFGYTYYAFPNSSLQKTQELVLSATKAESEWAPTLEVFHDFDEGTGTYARFTVSHALTKSPFPASFSASLGYNAQFFRTGSGLSDLLLTLRAPIKVSRNLAVVPIVCYSTGLDSGFDNHLFGGVSLAWGH